MATMTAAATLSQARRVVVKIGSALLVEDGGLRANWLLALAHDVAALRARGADVVVVSSGPSHLGAARWACPQGRCRWSKARLRHRSGKSGWRAPMKKRWPPWHYRRAGFADAGRHP